MNAATRAFALPTILTTSRQIPAGACRGKELEVYINDQKFDQPALLAATGSVL